MHKGIWIWPQPQTLIRLLYCTHSIIHHNYLQSRTNSLAKTRVRFFLGIMEINALFKCYQITRAWRTFQSKRKWRSGPYKGREREKVRIVPESHQREKLRHWTSERRRLQSAFPRILTRLHSPLSQWARARIYAVLYHNIMHGSSCVLSFIAYHLCSTFIGWTWVCAFPVK